MPAQKKKDAAPMLIFYGLIILFAIFSVVATLFIWVSWISCEFFYAKYSRTPSLDTINLDNDEEYQLQVSIEEISTIEDRLVEIEQEGIGVRRRKDGLFHGGSAIGARLNTEIVNLLQDLSDLKATHHELLSLPKQRLQEWCAPLCRIIAFRWAVATYIIIFIFGIKFHPSSVILMNQWMLHLLSDYLPAYSQPIYGVIGLASLISSISLLIAFVAYKKIIYSHYSNQMF